MRHNDRSTGKLITGPNHLMVMNAGRSFGHEERTLAGDPPLRMLQIFVRPHTTDPAELVLRPLNLRL
jgi:redox-sensitive bicupin YhaK (pirin superfamily)